MFWRIHGFVAALIYALRHRGDFNRNYWLGQAQFCTDLAQDYEEEGRTACAQDARGFGAACRLLGR